MPSIDPLKYSYRFKDSILFTSDTLSLSVLPQNIDSINFKIISHSQICFLIRADSNMERVPNFLTISSFEKSDTGYYVQIASKSCLPFGGGGIMGIYISKEKDSFIVKSKMTSSIN